MERTIKLEANILLFLAVLICVWSVTLVHANSTSITWLTDFIRGIGATYGNTQSWVNGSIKYRDKIADIHDLVSFASIVMFCVGFFKPRANGWTARYADAWIIKKIAGFIFIALFVWISQDGFGSDEFVENYESLESYYLWFFLNTMLGLLMLEYMVLYLAYVFGAIFKILAKDISQRIINPM